MPSTTGISRSISTTSGARSTQSSDRLLAVRRLADELDVGECREQLLQAVPHDRVVVGDEHADHETGTSRTNVVPSPGAR